MLDNSAYISGYSMRLAYAKDSDELIDNLQQGKVVKQTYWLNSEEAVQKCNLSENKRVARLACDNDGLLDLLYGLVDDALEKAKLDAHCLSGENVRVYLTGLGPRVDVIDYGVFYDHNDVEDFWLTKSIGHLHVSNMSQDRLASGIAKRYRLKYSPPNLHCTSNSSLSALHLGTQAIASGGVDLVVVINCSQIKTQDISFLDSQSMLRGDIVQPFGEQSKSVLFAEGFCVMVLESRRHREARQMPGGVCLRSTYAQIGAGRSNDVAYLGASMLKVMNKSLNAAGLGCDELAAIIPHANGSEASDKAEAQAITALLGENSVPVLAYKGQIGYTTTGSGLIDLIIGHYSLCTGELLSPVGTAAIRENMVRHVLLNKGTVKHNKKHVLKMGMGVDGSIIGVIMSDNNDDVK